MPQKNDYLKYWRVIKYFTQVKYKLKAGDLDMLLFLYSEKYFGKQKFNEFNELLPWDIKRFNKKTLYEISYKGKRMISSIYKKLNGEEIPMTESANPMFAKNVSYTDKVYRNMIKSMNKEIREQRQHHFQK